MEAFAHAKVGSQEDSHSGMALITQLLTTIRELLADDPPRFQALFIDAQCFVHLLSLLNGDYSLEDGVSLSLQVVTTLIALLAGNNGAKVRERACVSMIRIVDIISRKCREQNRIEGMWYYVGAGTCWWAHGCVGLMAASHWLCTSATLCSVFACSADYQRV